MKQLDEEKEKKEVERMKEELAVKEAEIVANVKKEDEPSLMFKLDSKESTTNKQAKKLVTLGIMGTVESWLKSNEATMSAVR